MDPQLWLVICSTAEIRNIGPGMVKPITWMASSIFRDTETAEIFAARGRQRGWDNVNVLPINITEKDDTFAFTGPESYEEVRRQVSS